MINLDTYCLFLEGLEIERQIDEAEDELTVGKGDAWLLFFNIDLINKQTRNLKEIGKFKNEIEMAKVNDEKPESRSKEMISKLREQNKSIGDKIAKEKENAKEKAKQLSDEKLAKGMSNVLSRKKKLLKAERQRDIVNAA